MSVRLIPTVLLSLILVAFAAPMASADQGEGHRGPIEKIIAHAKELGLTADQISKLKAIHKEAKTSKESHKEIRAEVKAVLTAEQIEKIKEYIKDHKKTQ